MYKTYKMYIQLFIPNNNFHLSSEVNNDSAMNTRENNKFTHRNRQNILYLSPSSTAVILKLNRHLNSAIALYIMC